ncbi:hypothetical protein POM88_044907 [Heracleum sosnowskyi]|uniref:Retrotransposon gag domain-containing protein n=1 Tax=Heracleum sosnowskyi TaxID=360622 RepID=A0AAD8H641_9APIA|nr:hypothetical protein POM88_044907 [Heracleum sosnowskyi]
MTPRRRPANDPEAQNPGMAQLLELLRQQTTTIAQQQQLLQQLQPPQPPPATVTAFKTFQSVNPPEFRGSQDPVEAHACLKEIEKAFALVNVGNDQKVEYASYFLKGESNYWWESARTLEAAEVITWDRFKRMFLDKYFPRYMQTQMEMKFFELRQENMTIGEYEKKFTELARFVGEYVDSELKRAKRFQQGLKPWIRSRVTAFELTTYAEVVQKAMVIEGESEQNQKEKSSKKRRFEAGEEGSSHKGQNQKNNPRFKPQQGPGNFRKKEFGNRSQENRSQTTSGQRPRKHQCRNVRFAKSDIQEPATKQILSVLSVMRKAIMLMSVRTRRLTSPVLSVVKWDMCLENAKDHAATNYFN